MLHIIAENNELKNRTFPLPDGVRKILQNTLVNYKGDKTVDGYKRLNNILNMQTISYHELKRIKNFFDHYSGSDKSAEFILNGGEPMKTWVNNTLYTATKAVHDFKQAKKDAGVDNAFIKSHSKDRQNKKKNKPTQVKFNTNNVNKNMINATSMKYESIIRESVAGHELNSSLENKHMTIVITEKQQKKLQEAADDKFSLEELSSIPSFSDRFNYCTQHLGEHIGKGSSRATFQIDDEKVLKLAWNNKGLSQNIEEMRTYNAPIFPNVYDYDEDGKWIISEFVLPAKSQDFMHCFGLTFKEFVSFILSCDEYRFNRRYFRMVMPEDEWLSLLEKYDELSEFDEYIGNYGNQRFSPVGDMIRITNYGLTQRNGEATIVLLDSGLTEDVWNMHYKR